MTLKELYLTLMNDIDVAEKKKCLILEKRLGQNDHYLKECFDTTGISDAPIWRKQLFLDCQFNNAGHFK